MIQGVDIPEVMSPQDSQAYLRTAVMTATPEQLQLMLYDGAIRFALQAQDAIRRRDYEESFHKLTRAQNIILEMQGGLNHDVNPDLCERIAGIYNFLYRKLVEANVGRSAAAIDDAVRVLRVERETWQTLVNKVGKLRGETPPRGAALELAAGFSAQA